MAVIKYQRYYARSDWSIELTNLYSIVPLKTQFLNLAALKDRTQIARLKFVTLILVIIQKNISLLQTILV